MTRRAQISIEMFLAFALFAFILYWMNYMVGGMRDSTVRTSELAQAGIGAGIIAAAANDACAFNQSVSFNLPCVVAAGEAAPYWANRSGSDISMQVISDDPVYAEKKVVCGLEDFSFYEECNETGRRVCTWLNESGKAAFKEGACP
ncbi:Uncharacterised protein [Candidatus Norongarragalina meridionalis]|nr:Uncharacterised protein [Candidatus Norongarragalina meridionalis]